MNPRLSQPILASLVQTLRRWLKRHPEAQDPYARVRVPAGKGPSNRSTAIALKEPDK
jgi:GrpB-like predicted nucleotidyltransferase (UPF0157 family)